MVKITKAPLVCVVTAISSLLSGCFVANDCATYEEGVVLDRNQDGLPDFRYLFMGDSIVEFNSQACRSMGHQVGKALGEQVQLEAVTGQRLEEIIQQYTPPVDTQSDYHWVVVNGGVNNLTQDELWRDDLCDCNGYVNHGACMQMIDDLSNQMSGFVQNIQSSSNAKVALMTYYPTDDDTSFIGACFPYVEQLNDRYRQLSYDNSRLYVLETYGDDVPYIEKLNQFGYDKYHPTSAGSEVLAQQALDLFQSVE